MRKRTSGGGEVRLDVGLIRRASVASGKCTGPLSDAARPPYPIYTPHIDCGDYVVIVNADKVKVTGKKLDQKIYYHHSDYVGGMKETTLREMMAKKPEKVVELAVKGMLPKGPLGKSMITKLHVYAGPEHEQAAQKPEVLEFKF